MKKEVAPGAVVKIRYQEKEYIVADVKEKTSLCTLWNIDEGFVSGVELKRLILLSEPQKRFKQIVFVDSDKKQIKVVRTIIGSTLFFRHIRNGLHPASILHHLDVKISDFKTHVI